MTLIFYDIPSARLATPGAWSFNTWKTRLSLNIKGIPYITQWVDYPDIEPLSKKLGIKPTGKRPDGSDIYSLPAIHDPSTGVYLADSFLIAEYLDNTYPNTVPLFPRNIVGLQYAFGVALVSLMTPIWGFADIPTYNILSPRNGDYFRCARESALGCSMEDAAPRGERAINDWKKFEENLNILDSWYAKTDDRGPYFMGKDLTWTDVVVGSHLIWLRTVFGEGSEKFKDIERWNGGRWKNFLKELELYSKVN